jgi:glycosyltransferase involved in cell wall biosynthesis
LIVVQTIWNREVFKSCGVNKPITVAPFFPVQKPVPENLTIPDLSDDTFLFYNISTWTERKGLDITIRAFFEEFNENENVALLIKTTPKVYKPVFLWHFFGKWRQQHYYTSRNELKRLEKKYSKGNKVILITDDLSEKELAGIQQRGDCYFSLCKAEGWGLGAFDAALCGNPVIITGFGGQSAFLPGEYAYLVDYKLIPAVDKIHKNISEDQLWAEPDLKHAKELLRKVYEEKYEAKKKGIMLQSYILNNFEEEVIIKKLIDDINKMFI